MIKPAECSLQYSNRFTVPQRLCSIAVRDEENFPNDAPSVPANTLGLAAQSITQSTAGTLCEKASSRRSVSKTRTPCRSKVDRLMRLPARKKLSHPTRFQSGRDPAMNRASAEPTKPQTPVIRTRISQPQFPQPQLDRHLCKRVGLDQLPSCYQLLGAWAQSSNFVRDDRLLRLARLFRSLMQFGQLDLAIATTTQFFGAFNSHSILVVVMRVRSVIETKSSPIESGSEQ